MEVSGTGRETTATGACAVQEHGISLPSRYKFTAAIAARRAFPLTGRGAGPGACTESSGVGKSLRLWKVALPIVGGNELYNRYMSGPSMLHKADDGRKMTDD